MANITTLIPKIISNRNQAGCSSHFQFIKQNNEYLQHYTFCITPLQDLYHSPISTDVINNISIVK